MATSERRLPGPLHAPPVWKQVRSSAWFGSGGNGGTRSAATSEPAPSSAESKRRVIRIGNQCRMRALDSSQDEVEPQDSSGELPQHLLAVIRLGGILVSRNRASLRAFRPFRQA